MNALRMIVIAFALLAQHAAQAQSPRNPPAPAPTPPAVQSDRPPRPYELDLLQLVETLGSIAYLTDLCAERDPALWRTRVAEILETESGNPQLRERLAGAYNKGFQGYQATHRICTERSKAAIDLLLETGQRQSQRLRSRYGG